MDLHLSDKHTLITGGSKGIGLACAQGFLAEGARLSLVSRDSANPEAARGQGAVVNVVGHGRRTEPDRGVTDRPGVLVVPSSPKRRSRRSIAASPVSPHWTSP